MWQNLIRLPMIGLSERLQDCGVFRQDLVKFSDFAVMVTFFKIDYPAKNSFGNPGIITLF